MYVLIALSYACLYFRFSINDFLRWFIFVSKLHNIIYYTYFCFLTYLFFSKNNCLFSLEILNLFYRIFFGFNSLFSHFLVPNIFGPPRSYPSKLMFLFLLMLWCILLKSYTRFTQLNNNYIKTITFFIFTLHQL